MRNREQTFEQYCLSAEKYLVENYCIGFDDTGIAEKDLREAYEDGESEIELVENLARKYDLDPKDLYGKRVD